VLISDGVLISDAVLQPYSTMMTGDETACMKDEDGR
jgi:hypothetical protein